MRFNMFLWLISHGFPTHLPRVPSNNNSFFFRTCSERFCLSSFNVFAFFAMAHGSTSLHLASNAQDILVNLSSLVPFIHLKWSVSHVILHTLHDSDVTPCGASVEPSTWNLMLKHGVHTCHKPHSDVFLFQCPSTLTSKTT